MPQCHFCDYTYPEPGEGDEARAVFLRGCAKFERHLIRVHHVDPEKTLFNNSRGKDGQHKWMPVFDIEEMAAAVRPVIRPGDTFGDVIGRVAKAIQKP